MTLRPRKTSHRNRVGWTRIKSKGWGSKPLSEKVPKIPHLTKRRFLVSLLIFLTASYFAGFYDLPSSHANCVSTPYEIHAHLPCGDPVTTYWDETSASFMSDFNTVNAIATTGLNANNGIKLVSTASQSAIALSKVQIDMSTSVGKLLLMFNQWNWMNNTNTIVNTCTGCPTFGWYLTKNSTLPTENNYNPFNDANVAFVFRMTLPSATQVYNVVGIQRQGYASINSQINCGTASATCFTDSPFQTVSSTTQNLALAQLNYTGKGANGGNNGVSFITVGNNLGTVINVAPFPWLQITGASYYLGFYQLPQGGVGGAGAFWYTDGPSANFMVGSTNGSAMLLAYQVITTGTVSPTSSTVDTGGFFGQIWNGILNIGLFVPSIVSGVPLTQLKTSANNVGTAFLAMLFQFFNIMVQTLKTILDGVGSVFGVSNLGTNIFNALNGIATMFGQIASAITNFLANLVSRGLDLITIVTTFSTVFFTGIQKFLSEMTTISSGIVTIFSKLFLYGGAFYFLYDLILYFQLTGDAGFEGIGTWIGFNKWAAFSVFGLLTRILTALISAIDWILSHIPWISPRMPENGFPGIPQLSAGDFPGLRIPTGHVAKLREGDPAAFFLWAVGGFLILPFYLGSAISPLAGLTAAVGCNPTTCFNNMLTTVGYPFAGLFIIIFVGVTITEILHGITDVGGQRIVIQNKLPAGFGQFKKAAKGEFQFGTGRFAQFKKGRAKQSKSKAVERQETISREQAYENRHGSSVFE